MNTLAERIKKARKDAGLTQKQLADKAGVEQPVISQLETGKNLQSAHIAKIAHVCGVNAMWLSEGTGKPDIGTNAESALPPVQTYGHPETAGRIYSVPLISLGQAVSWVSGGYKMPDFEIEAYLPCAVPVGERAFAFRMLNDSMAGLGVERPIHKGWAVFVDPDSKPEQEQLALASIDGREPILGALTAHGGRLYIKPSNAQYEKEEVDPNDPAWCLGRAVFVGFSI